MYSFTPIQFFRITSMNKSPVTMNFAVKRRGWTDVQLRAPNYLLPLRGKQAVKKALDVSLFFALG